MENEYSGLIFPFWGKAGFILKMDSQQQMLYNIINK